MEIERKYLIEMPNIPFLINKLNAYRKDITQTYLKSDESGAERRVRKITAGCTKYVYTEKKEVSFGVREEVERDITEDEYNSLLNEKDTSKKPIHKYRYTFNYAGNTLEIDIYEFWDDKAILEIELDNINDATEIPEIINIIKDVTGDKQYSNSALASIT